MRVIPARTERLVLTTSIRTTAHVSKDSMELIVKQVGCFRSSCIKLSCTLLKLLHPIRIVTNFLMYVFTHECAFKGIMLFRSVSYISFDEHVNVMNSYEIIISNIVNDCCI